MRSFQFLIGLLLIVLGGATADHAVGAQSKQTTAETSSFPKDIYPDTGNRLPAIKREDLDDAGKKLFDAKGPSDTFGPGSIRLYSLPVAQYAETTNDFLRHKAGIDPRIVELVILVTAREADCAYVWNAHEPQGLKAGLPKETIDIVRNRKPIAGVAEKDAAIIQLGREVLEIHHVDSETAARALKLFGKQGMVNIISLMGDYASTEILLNTFDQHVRPSEKSLLPIP
ncbi:MAG TPA: carboxymuconolactone decarboxylase family protein [Candidatus Saccharimonadales bacterium]|jgi:4-carboxymuconolactone decarboxylase|nr:carboxymuconolactone decarboxylase family protein [Candidatus Saccharimonadales bacterium]